MIEQNNQFNFIATKLKGIEAANQNMQQNINEIENTKNNLTLTNQDKDCQNNKNNNILFEDLINNLNKNTTIKLDEIKANLNANQFEIINDLKDTLLSEIRLSQQFNTTQIKNMLDTAVLPGTSKDLTKDIGNTFEIKTDRLNQNNQRRFESSLKIVE